MSNRAQQLQNEIAQSMEIAGGGEPHAPPKPKRRRVDIRILTTSWAGQDCRFYFLEAAASVGFKAQTIEKQAVALGKKPLDFFDESRERKRKECPECNAQASLRANVCGNCGKPFAPVPKGLTTPALREFLRKNELAPGYAARPSHGRQVKVITNPEKITDAHLDAIRRYRRVEAGMNQLRRESGPAYQVLELAFLPKRSGESEPKIERQFGHLRGLALRSGPIVLAHAAALKSQKEPVPHDVWDQKKKGPVPLTVWLEWRIDAMDKTLGFEKDDVPFEGKLVKLSAVLLRALEDAEQQAIEAIERFERCCEKPPEVVKEEAEAAEKQAARARGEPVRRGPRAPKESVLSTDAPPPFLDVG